MEKVKVTKIEAKALERHSLWFPVMREAIENYMNYSDGWVLSNAPLKEMGFDKFVECLCLGYEVKQTKEEQLVEFYNDEETQYCVRKGIRIALDMLGIQIEGINQWTK